MLPASRMCPMQTHVISIKGGMNESKSSIRSGLTASCNGFSDICVTKCKSQKQDTSWNRTGYLGMWEILPRICTFSVHIFTREYLIERTYTWGHQQYRFDNDHTHEGFHYNRKERASIWPNACCLMHMRWKKNHICECLHMQVRCLYMNAPCYKHLCAIVGSLVQNIWGCVPLKIQQKNHENPRVDKKQYLSFSVYCSSPRTSSQHSHWFDLSCFNNDTRGKIRKITETQICTSFMHQHLVIKYHFALWREQISPLALVYSPSYSPSHEFVTWINYRQV